MQHAAPDLPAGVVRFLHTSDLQLGMTLWFLEGEAQHRYTQDRIEAIRRIGKIAKEEGAQFVVVAGDVFEHSQVQPATIRRALDAMAAVPVPVLLLPGNHDPLQHGGIWDSEIFQRNQPANVQVLRKDAIRVLDGVEIVGAPWPNKRPLRDLCDEALNALEPAPPGLVRLLVGHGQTDRFEPDPDKPATISTARLEHHLGRGAVHYVALGDRHSSTDAGGAGRIRYSGTPEPTDFNEVRPGKCLLVDVSPTQATVKEVDVGQWTFSHQTLELAGDVDLPRLQAFFDDFPAKQRTAIKLGVKATLSLSGSAAYEATLDAARHLFASIQPWPDQTRLAVAPTPQDLESLRLSGFADEALRELQQVASEPGPRQGAARDSLDLLFRLATAPGALA